jgi:hypothetical protein
MAANTTTAVLCDGQVCAKPRKQYERILHDKPGLQWNDAGGYCGSWSIQRAALTKGAWISQQQVRDHTVAGGGHDEEILESNIDLALANLKLKAEAWDFKNEAVPQIDGFRKWMKKQLAAGHPLVMMIMLPYGTYPVYPGLDYGLYSHIEPFIGIMSDHPLTDEDFYDDDYVVHYDDASTNTYYRSFQSLPGKYAGWAQCPGQSGGSDMCLHPDRGFGWAVLGLNDDRTGMDLSLAVEPWQREPDTRSGASPSQLSGTITVEGLTVGAAYAIYRWDSVESAFDYSQATVVHNFKAADTTEVFADPTTILSSGVTYYRCLPDSSGVLV